MSWKLRSRRPTTGVTPFLSIAGGRGQEALALYERAFGARITECNLADDGHRVAQASFRVNGGWLMLADEFPEFGGKSTQPASVLLHMKVTDADSWFVRALANGCAVVMPIGDKPWGDRFGSVKDPFGHKWSMGSPLLRET